jgi:Domain of unknown function (DUF4105)
MARRASRLLLRVLAAIAILTVTAWCAFALALSPLQARTPAIVMVACGVSAALATLFGRQLRIALPLFALAVAAFAVAWSSVKPSNDRDWQTDVAVLPYATFDGDLVTIHNIRNFDYRTETDFTPQYYDKTFDLRDLDTADLVTSYWMGDAIAHVMMSFGFAERDFVTVSIETRKEKGESYSTVNGFFRQYELIYIVGDERDLVRLRTNYRKDPPEEVYVFRTNAPKENVRRLFLDYFKTINSLRTQPQFYNTLTTNCTTNVVRHTRVNPGGGHYSWKVLLSGYAPQYAYERGRLDQSISFEELKRRSHINDAAHAADQDPDFSRRIRVGLPRPPTAAR